MDPYLDRIIERARDKEAQRLRAAAEEKDKRIVPRLSARGYSPEDIAEIMELDIELVKEWLSAPAVV